MQSRIPEKVQALMLQLREAGLRPVLMGGAVRDLYHGREPRDWDILFLSYDVALDGDACDALDVVDTHGYRNYEFFPSYGDSRLFGVLKLHDDNIDLIFREGDNSDAAELANKMDTTLNAYWIDPSESWKIQHLPRASHLTGLIEVLDTLDPPNPGRLEYLAEKYPQYKVQA